MARMPIIQFHSCRTAHFQVGAYFTITKLELISIITGVGQDLRVHLELSLLVLEMRPLRPWQRLDLPKVLQ